MMSTAPWLAVLMIFFHDGTFVEVRAEKPVASVEQCVMAGRALYKRTEWPAVVWRYGRIAHVKFSCRQDGIDEIDL